VRPCVVVADDLTGSCDTGVHFAAAGFETIVCLGPESIATCPADVVVINTRTRSQPSLEGIRRVRDAVARAPECSVLYKKIDSTIHGHVVAEVVAALESSTRRSAVIAPAYPRLGRTVQDGILHVFGSPRVRLRDLFSRSLTVCSDLESVSREEHLGYIPDMFSDEDVARICDEVMLHRSALLFVGSGGLAREIAPRLAREFDAPSRPHRQPEVRQGPLAVFVGSHNPVTIQQVERLLASGLPVEAIDVRIDAGYGPAEKWIAQVRASRAILFCGGESAQLVCGALGARTMTLQDEIAPGVPWAIVNGGIADGIPVATKAGGFGTEDTLVKAAEFFIDQ